MFNPNNLNLLNIESLYHAMTGTSSTDDKSPFYKERACNLILFKEKLLAAYKMMSKESLCEDEQSPPYEMLVGGSSVWQYINALVHGTHIFEGTDTDSYAVPKEDYLKILNQSRWLLIYNLACAFNIPLDSIKGDGTTDFIVVKYHGHDFSVVNQLEVFCNFQAFIVENGDIVYDKNNPKHAADFRRFIFNHEIICYGLEALLEPSSRYAEKLLNDQMACEKLVKVKIAETAGARLVTEPSTPDAQAFRKLAFVFKSFHKPFQANKVLSKETAHFFHQFFKSGNANLRDQIVTQMVRLYKDSFPGRASATMHMNDIEKMANGIVDADIKELKEQKAKEDAAKDAEIIKLRAQIEQEKSDHLKEMAKLKSGHAQSLRQVKESHQQHSGDIKELKGKLHEAEQKIISLTDSNKSQLVAARELAEENFALQERNKAIKQEFEQLKQKMEKEAKEMRDQINALKQQNQKEETEKQESIQNTIKEQNTIDEPTKAKVAVPAEPEEKEVPVMKPDVQGESADMANAGKKSNNKNKKKGNGTKPVEVDAYYESYTSIARAIRKVLLDLAKSEDSSTEDAQELANAAKAAFDGIPLSSHKTSIQMFSDILRLLDQFKDKKIKGALPEMCAAVMALKWDNYIRNDQRDILGVFRTFRETLGSLLTFMNSGYASAGINRNYLNKLTSASNALSSIFYIPEGNSPALDAMIDNVNKLCEFYTEYEAYISTATQMLAEDKDIRSEKLTDEALNEYSICFENTVKLCFSSGSAEQYHIDAAMNYFVRLKSEKFPHINVNTMTRLNAMVQEKIKNRASTLRPLYIAKPLQELRTYTRGASSASSSSSAVSQQPIKTFFDAWYPMAIIIDKNAKGRKETLKQLFADMKQKFPDKKLRELFMCHFDAITYLNAVHPSHKKIRASSPLYTELTLMLDDKFLEKHVRINLQKAMEQDSPILAQIEKAKEQMSDANHLLFSSPAERIAILYEIIQCYLRQPGVDDEHKVTAGIVHDRILDMIMAANMAAAPKELNESPQPVSDEAMEISRTRVLSAARSVLPLYQSHSSHDDMYAHWSSMVVVFMGQIARLTQGSMPIISVGDLNVHYFSMIGKIRAHALFSSITLMTFIDIHFAYIDRFVGQTAANKFSHPLYLGMLHILDQKKLEEIATYDQTKKESFLHDAFKYFVSSNYFGRLTSSVEVGEVMAKIIQKFRLAQGPDASTDGILQYFESNIPIVARLHQVNSKTEARLSPGLK